MKNIIFGIIGYGIVGKATHLSFVKENPVRIHDIVMDTNLQDLHDCTDVFLCVPTEGKKCIEQMIETIKELRQINNSCNIIIRSTLPIGSCKKIQDDINDNILYIPEFLRERFWESDCQKKPVIVGGDRKPEWLPEKDVLLCSHEDAEVLKMFSNNFAVMRIAFANLFYDISTKVGADYDLVKETYLNIAHSQSYMDVPGHDGHRGFGGKCLPKDLDFLIETVSSLDVDASWLESIRKLNEQWIKSRF